jgi:hypothetical protein
MSGEGTRVRDIGCPFISSKGAVFSVYEDHRPLRPVSSVSVPV